jgi:hypothetical protein
LDALLRPVAVNSKHAIIQIVQIAGAALLAVVICKTLMPDITIAVVAANIPQLAIAAIPLTDPAGILSSAASTATCTTGQ